MFFHIAVTIVLILLSPTNSYRDAGFPDSEYLFIIITSCGLITLIPYWFYVCIF